MARYTKGGDVVRVPQINSELEKIETSIADLLSRKGDTPNEMLNTLDMNSNRITNLPAPTNGSDAARFADVGGGVFTVATDEALVFDNILEATTADSVAGQYVRCKRYYSGGELVEGLVYEVQASATVDNFIDHANANGTFLVLNQSSHIYVEQAGARGDGTTDDTLSIRACLSSGKDVYLRSKTYLVSLGSSEDAGNDRIINLSSTTSTVFVGQGRSSKLKLDLVNSFDGSFDAVGFDLRDATGGQFTIGNFTVDGNSSEAKPSQNNVLVRLQTGTLITATSYSAELLPIWVENGTGGGCYLGCDSVIFDTIYADNCGEHGVAIRNTSGDGRLISINGNSIIANNNANLAFDYSGGSQVNNGPCLSSIKSIYGRGNGFGVKIAGDHKATLGHLYLKDTNLLNQSADSAFYSNSPFTYFKVDNYYCEDSYNGALSHAQEGELTVGNLISINNNSSGNANGDIVQGNQTYLKIDNYSAIGHVDSTKSINVLESNYTEIGVSQVKGFDSASQYPISVQTNGYAKLKGSEIEQDNDNGIYILRADTLTSGNIHVEGFSFTGSKLGQGVRAQGTGTVFFTDLNVEGFTQNNIVDSGRIGIYSGVKGFGITTDTTSLEDITSRENTSNKYEGKEWFNATTNKIVFATSNTAGGVWVNAQGVTVHSPI